MRCTLKTTVQVIQSRIDDLLKGEAKPSLNAARSKDDDRLFAEFLPSDKQRALGIAAICIKKAKRLGGLEGIEAAVNYLYEALGSYPDGMVEYACKSFLVHYPPAREHLVLRSLEERQPKMVRPS